MNEQSKIILFVWCCAMAGVMAFLAFSESSVWNMVFAALFTLAAFLCRPPWIQQNPNRNGDKLPTGGSRGRMLGT